MKLRNNNRAILKKLAKVSYRGSKSRNRLMIGAICLVVMLIFSSFSMIAGRYDAEYLMSARSSGSVISTYIENPSSEQIKEISGLSYIKEAELEWNFGVLLQDGYTIASCSAMDEAAYKEMYAPAFTDIEGNFPKGEDEVMLSRETLRILGIDNPRIGQKVPVSMEVESGDSQNRKLTLSGVYTGYKSEGPQSAFFSVDVLESFPSLDRDLCSLLLIKQSDPMSGEYVEEKLYEDVKTLDEAQQYLGGEGVNYYVMYNIAGSYQVGAVCLALILLCAWLLISNVMSVSLNKDIRYYGLLKTLGTTRRQIRKIILKQTGKIALVGSLSGAVLGTGTVLLLLPKLLENMYLGNYGEASAMMSFHPAFLILAVLFSLLVTIASTLEALRRVSRVSAVEAFRYTDAAGNAKRKKRSGENGSRIWRFAWRNVFANRRKAFLTLGSLFLGITLALGVTVIVRGLDTTNEIEAGHDFVISYDERVSIGGTLSSDQLRSFRQAADPDGLAEAIKKLDGIQAYRETYASYVSFDYNDPAWEPLLKANRLWDGLARNEEEKEKIQYKKEQFMGAIATIDEEGIDQLERYAEENGLDIDFDCIRNGTGALNLHFHELSKQTREAAEQVKGSDIAVKDLSGKELGQLKLAGYLDSYAKNLPDVIHLPMRSNAEPGLIVSEKAFENLGLEKKVNYIETDVDPNCETELKERIRGMIQVRTRELKETFDEDEVLNPEYVFYLGIKSDDLADAQSYILSMRIVMYSIVGLLLLMGVMNYFNVIAASLAARKKEFAIMEAIGMTRRQLRNMLLTEGFYYVGIVSLLVLTVGSGILVMLGSYMKQEKAYFLFLYPGSVMRAALGLMFAFCVLLPVVTYRKTVSESVIQRLRHNG